MKNEAVIYCRVSSKEQVKNLSLPTQKKACLDYCERNGINPGEIFVEEGESAKTTARPQFQKMLEYCRKNKNRIGFVVVYALTRFSRNTHDHLVLRDHLRKLDISLLSVTETFDRSPTGTFLETLVMASGQLENETKAERTKVGMRAAMERGRWICIPPVGLIKNGAPKNQSNIMPDPERAHLMANAFQLFSKGIYSQQKVLIMVTNMGLRNRSGKKLSLQTFTACLRNPLYAGWIVSKLLDAPVRGTGTFVPVVDQAVFDRVQMILDGRRPTITPHLMNHPEFPLRKFVRCGNCHHPLTGSSSRGGGGKIKKKHPYYSCPQCGRVRIRVPQLHLKFLEHLDKLKPMPEYVSLFRAIVSSRWREEQAQVVSELTALEKKIADLKQRRMTVVDAYLHEKRIGKDIYEEQLAKINEEIALAEIDAHDAKLEKLDIEGILGFAEHLILNASRLWSEMDLDQRQRFQKVLFPTGIEFDGVNFGTAVTCPFFNRLENSLPEKSREASPRGFEPLLLE